MRISDENKGINKALQIVTINVSRTTLRLIEKLRLEGLIASRSEYIRELITRGLKQDIEFKDNVKNYMKKEQEMILVPGYNGDKPFKVVRRLE